MANLNKVLLIGRLTRDPELRYIPSGSAVTDFGLAINKVWTGQDGKKHEDTTFVDITLWARQAEIASEYLHKGDPVFIEGRLQFDQWTDREGQKRSKLRVVGERMQFLTTRDGARTDTDEGRLSPHIDSQPGPDDSALPVPEPRAEPHAELRAEPRAETQEENIPF